MDKERLEKLAERIAKASNLPRNSHDAHEISRDYGFIKGVFLCNFNDSNDVEEYLKELEEFYSKRNIEDGYHG